MRIKVLLLIAVILICQNLFSQFDKNYVESSSININDEVYSVVKMSRKNNHVKVKYFAAKDFNGTSVGERFLSWSRNKRIIAYSSGTYMDYCDPRYAKPVGLCIDNGRLVNNTIKEKLDGLTIVYATGGIVVTNLRDGNLEVTDLDGTKKRLNIRDAYEREEFINWAKNTSATVFQTHLFYFNNQIQIFDNASQDKRERRFLVVGKDENGSVTHYIVNLSGANTIYNATEKVVKFLEKELDEIIFLVNLDTGCQDVFKLYKEDGGTDIRKSFQGKGQINQAANLIVYYYE
jgi:hypothetical protein